MLKRILRAFGSGTEKEFLVLLRAGTQNLVEMGELLSKILSSKDPHEKKSYYEPLEEKKNISQRLTHKIFAELSANFLTPIDKADLHQMAGLINAISNRLLVINKRIDLYEIKEITADEIKITALILKSISEINSAVMLLESIYSAALIKKHCVNINSLENEAGKVIGHALKSLLQISTDPIEQIKHVELIDILESTVDKCEEMANCLEGALTKMN